jgi:alanine dehydrogenase
MGSLPVFTDREIAPLLSEDSTVDAVISEVEEFMRDKKKGLVASPQRFVCEARDGELVITAGGSERKKVIGLRVYSTFDPEDREQLIAVYGMDGALKALFIGSAVGALRTAAINAVAMKYLARHDAKTLGVIGAGRQARSVVPVVCRVRDFQTVLIHSLHESSTSNFIKNAGQMLSRLGIDTRRAESAERLVSDADAVLTVTTSDAPVVKAEWFRAGQHLSTMGKKFREAHEIDPLLLSKADIVATDSMKQIQSYGEAFMGYDYRDKIRELGEYVDGEGRDDRALSVFLSIGLAGTEVVVANRLLEIAAKAGIASSEVLVTD